VHHIGKRKIRTFVFRSHAGEDTMIRISAKGFVVSAQWFPPVEDVSCGEFLACRK
jgi:hypothetical protein